MHNSKLVSFSGGLPQLSLYSSYPSSTCTLSPNGQCDRTESSVSQPWGRLVWVLAAFNCFMAIPSTGKTLHPPPWFSSLLAPSTSAWGIFPLGWLGFGSVVSSHEQSGIAQQLLPPRLSFRGLFLADKLLNPQGMHQ